MDISEELEKLILELGEMISHIYSKMQSIEAEEKRIQEKQDESYLRGLNDAWEAARRMLSMTSTECFNCFGDGDGQGEGYYFMDGIYKITPQEAIEKIRIYTEKKKAEEKEKLHVGDEIICISEYSLDYNKTFIYLGRDEYHMKMFNLDKMRAEFTNNFVDYCKTGKHFDSIPLPKGENK